MATTIYDTPTHPNHNTESTTPNCITESTTTSDQAEDETKTTLEEMNEEVTANLWNMSNDDFLHVRFLTNHLLRDRGLHFSIPSQPTNLPYAFDNAKYEQIACAGLKTWYSASITSEGRTRHGILLPYSP